jgi:hypothetical protein
MNKNILAVLAVFMYNLIWAGTINIDALINCDPAAPKQAAASAVREPQPARSVIP